MRLVVFGLPHHENQVKTKHVESSLIPRLDEGSSPSSSTIMTPDFAPVRGVESGVVLLNCGSVVGGGRGVLGDR